jgi:energy-converting hydrogenase Eha subunit C
MIDSDANVMHRKVVERCGSGEISIDVNKSSALVLYAKISRNPFVKIFNVVVRIYSFPLTIIGVIFASVFINRYLYLLLYVIGLVAIITFEAYLAQAVTVCSALANPLVFSRLYRRGVIHIRELRYPHIHV